MNTLTEKAKHNLKHLLEMGENDTFNSERGKLVEQEDFIQVNNTIDLEYAIYFTFHHYISSIDTNALYNDNLIQKLDTCIDNLYDNKQFNELLTNDDGFQKITDDIDNKLTHIKDRYYYQSPFYLFFKKYHNFYNFCKKILNENNTHIQRILRTTNIDINREYYEDEDEDEEEEGVEEGEGEGEEGEGDEEEEEEGREGEGEEGEGDEEEDKEK